MKSKNFKIEPNLSGSGKWHVLYGTSTDGYYDMDSYMSVGTMKELRDLLNQYLTELGEGPHDPIPCKPDQAHPLEHYIIVDEGHITDTLTSIDEIWSKYVNESSKEWTAFKQGKTHTFVIDHYYGIIAERVYHD